ncbi:Amino acid transporter transmembrane domain-containing protein [Entamoeba marina]
MPSFVATYFYTIQALLSPEFIVIPLIFSYTGVIFPIALLLCVITSIISLFLLNIAQQHSGLFNTIDVSLHCGGKSTLYTTRIIRIIYNVVLLGVIFTIISISLEAMLFSTSQTDSSNDSSTFTTLWKSSPIIKALLMDVFMHHSFLPIIYIAQCILLTVYLIQNGTSFVYSQIGNGFIKNIGLHKLIPSYSLLVILPFHFFALLYGSLYCFAFGFNMNSVPLVDLIYFFSNNIDSYYYGSVGIGVFIVFFFSLMSPYIFSLIYDDIETVYFSSWQPSLLRQFILSFMIMAVVGMSCALFWQCDIQLSLNGSIGGSYLVYFLPSAMAYHITKNSKTKSLCVILIFIGIITSSTGITGSLIHFIEQVAQS